MRVLVIDPDKARAALVAEGLADVKPLEVRSAQSFEAVEAELDAFAPDVIVIACDSPDRDTLENLREQTAHNPRPVVMFVDRSAPGLADATVVETRVGLRPAPEGDLPTAGPVDDRPGLYVSTGFGAGGLTMGPLIGDLLAERILATLA